MVSDVVGGPHESSDGSAVMISESEMGAMIAGERLTARYRGKGQIDMRMKS